MLKIRKLVNYYQTFNVAYILFLFYYTLDILLQLYFELWPVDGAQTIVNGRL